MSEIPASLALLLEDLSGAAVHLEERGAGFFIEARLGSAYVVIEGRPDAGEFGVTENPELFVGSDFVFATGDEAVHAAARLLRTNWRQHSGSSVPSPDEIRRRFPLSAQRTDVSALREWAARPALDPQAA